MDQQRLKIFNGKIITPDKIIEGGSILVTGNTITAVSENDIQVENAIEIDGDGDGDGLCESNETCLYTPNFGAYQGHGTFGQCTFTDGIISGVKMFGYETNGR